MFVLYVGALIILPLAMSPFLKFLAITFFTFIVCFLVYELILRRINILRPLFGLKWQSKNNQLNQSTVTDSPAKASNVLGEVSGN